MICREITAALATSGLILGIFPSPTLLRELDLWPQFGPMMLQLRLGNGAGMLQALETQREWHRRRSSYLLLQDKLQVGCWRCLIRKA